MTGDNRVADSPERVSHDPRRKDFHQGQKRQFEREDERDESEHFWDQLRRAVFNLGIVALLFFAFIIVIGAIISLGWHMLVPSRNWLEPEELRTVKEFMLSGAVVSLGMEYFRRYIKK